MYKLIVLFFCLLIFEVSLFSQTNPDLLKAVYRGDLEAIIQMNPTAEEINEFPWYPDESPFLLAIQLNYLDIAAFLLDSGADINIRSEKPDKWGMSAFQIAIKKRNKNAFDFLLKNGVSLDVSAGWEYNSYLALAIAYGTQEMVDVLIANGADINKNPDELIMAAIEGDKRDFISLYEDHDSDLSQINFGNSIFNKLKELVDTELIELLLKAGVKFDETQKSALLIASLEKGDEDMARIMVREAANVNSPNNRGLSPLMVALSKKNISMSRFLVEAGADLNYQNNQNSVWDYIFVIGDEKLAIWFLENGLDLSGDKLTSNGQSVISIILYKEWYQLLDEMINRKINLNVAFKPTSGILNLKESSPLKMAVAQNKQPLALKLIEGGAKPDFAGLSQETPLCLAVEMNNREMIQLLLDKGANPNGLGRFFTSPLFLAIKYNHGEILELLLDAGGDLHLNPGDMSESLFMRALEKGDRNVIEVLLKRGAAAAGKYDLPPLLWLILNRKYELAEYLVDKGTSVNDHNEKGQYLLEIFLGLSLNETALFPGMDFLLSHGADPMLCSKGDLLILAIESRYITIAKKLVDAGAASGQAQELAVKLGYDNLAQYIKNPNN